MFQYWLNGTGVKSVSYTQEKLTDILERLSMLHWLNKFKEYSHMLFYSPCMEGDDGAAQRRTQLHITANDKLTESQRELTNQTDKEWMHNTL